MASIHSPEARILMAEIYERLVRLQKLLGRVDKRARHDEQSPECPAKRQKQRQQFNFELNWGGMIEIFQEVRGHDVLTFYPDLEEKFQKLQELENHIHSPIREIIRLIHWPRADSQDSWVDLLNSPLLDRIRNLCYLVGSGNVSEDIMSRPLSEFF